jgi:O-antigen/teichoic acid export membrane protein
MSPNISFNKFAKGTYLLILDNLVNLGVGAIFWIVLAKMVDPGIIGQAMVITGFGTTIVGFSGHGIQVALSKFMSEYNAKNMPTTVKTILRNGIKAGLIISAAIVVVISLLSGQIATWAYQDESLALLLVFMIVTFVPTQTIVWVVIGAFQGMQIMKYVTVSDLVFQISRISFVIFAVLYGLDVFGILLGFSIASFLAMIVCYFYLLPRAIPKSSEQEQVEPKEGMKHITRFTGLNYFTIGIKTLNLQFGILVLGTISFEWAAFYGLALLISKIVGSFSHSVGMALLPSASEQLVNGNKDQVRKMVNTAVRISIMISGLGFILIMIDPAYFLNLISDKYVEAAWAMRILAIAAITTSIAYILSSLLNALNRAKDVARIGFISATSSILLTIILSTIFGLEGAAIALFIGSIINLGMSLVTLKSKDNVVLSPRTIVKPFIVIIGASMIGYIFSLWNHQVLLGIVLAFACYIAFSIAYKVTTKHEIRQLISIAMNKKRTK